MEADLYTRNRDAFFAAETSLEDATIAAADRVLSALPDTGVVDLRHPERSEVAHNLVLLHPFGSGAEDNTIVLRVSTLRPRKGGTGYVLTTRWQGTVTLGTVDVARGNEDELYAKTLTAALKGVAVDDYVISGTASKAGLLIDAHGAPYLYLEAGTATGATDVNAEVALL